jgi:hypothetical protein
VAARGNAANLLGRSRSKGPERVVSGIIGVLYARAGIGALIGRGAAGLAFDISRGGTVPVHVCAAANVTVAAVMATTSKPATKTEAKSGPRD